MSARFRYLARDGREVEVSTTDELVRAFMSGSLQNDTLLYDAEGGGWAPARNQSALLDVSLPPISLTFTEPSAQGADEVLEQLRRERQESSHPVPMLEGLTGPRARVLESRAERLPAVAAPVPPVEPAPRTTPPPPARPLTDPAARPAVARVTNAPTSSVAPHPPRPTAFVRAEMRPSPRVLSGRPAPSVRREAQRPRRAVAALGAITSGLAGLAVALFLIVLLSDADGRSAVGTTARAQVPDARASASFASVPGVPASVSEAEAAALSDMLMEIDRLRSAHEVESVPEAWLEGIYLAEGGRYPEVRGYWERYQAYVEDVRTQESEIFRRSLIARLQREGLSNAALSMRVGRGLREFEADRARRDAVYASLLELTSAAIDLHELLVEHEDEISYEPASQGISRDPVTEAVPESRGLAAEMNRRLDRLFLAIEQTQGSRIAPRDQLPNALRRGLALGQEPPMR